MNAAFRVVNLFFEPTGRPFELPDISSSIYMEGSRYSIEWVFIVQVGGEMAEC